MNPAPNKSQKRKAKFSPRQKSLLNESKKLLKKARKVKKQNQMKMQFSEESDLSDQDRTRTPSGMELSGKVQGIRTFFSPVNKQNQVSEQADSHELSSTLNVSANAESIECDGRAVQRSCEMEREQKVNSGTHQIMISDKNNNNGDMLTEEDRFLRSLAKQLKPLEGEEFEKKMLSRSASTSNIKGLQEQTRRHSIRMVSSKEANDDDNPKIVAVNTVVESIKALRNDIAAEIRTETTKIRTDINEDLKKWKNEYFQEVKEVVDQQISDHTQVKELKAEVAYWKIKAETLTEVCERFNTEMTDLTTRLETIELNSAKKKAIITGVPLPDEKDKDVNIAALSEFLSKTLGVPVTVDDYFMIGEGPIRPIVIIFPTLEEKRKVMYHKTNLKDVRIQGSKIFINDYLPPAALEKRKKDQFIVNRFRDKGQDERLTYIKGVLSVDGSPYQRRIKLPSPKDLISVSPEEISEILNIRTNRGDEFIKQKSSFIGYAAEVSSYTEIEQVYKKN